MIEIIVNDRLGKKGREILHFIYIYIVIRNKYKFYTTN